MMTPLPIAARTLAAAGLAATLALSAAAQPENPPPLRGPDARPREIPGVRGRFGDSPEGRRGAMADRLPPRAMRTALGAIMNDDAPENIRATPEQREKIRDIQRDFETKLREFAQEHRQELEDLRAKLPGGGPAAELLRRLDGERAAPPNRSERRRDNNQPPMRRPMDDRTPPTPPPPELREQLRTLMESMPQFDNAYTRIWDELTPTQREVVEDRIAEFRERQARLREDAYVNDRTRPGAPRPERPRSNARDADERMGADTATRPSGRKDRLLRLFDRLSPEQQEQLLERIEARLRDAGAPASRMRPARGQPKPPPDIDGVRLPSPKDMDDDRPTPSPQDR